MHRPWQSSTQFHKRPYRDVNKTLERVIPGELYFMLYSGDLMRNWVLPGSKYLELPQSGPMPEMGPLVSVVYL